MQLVERLIIASCTLAAWHATVAQEIHIRREDGYSHSSRPPSPPYYLGGRPEHWQVRTYAVRHGIDYHVYGYARSHKQELCFLLCKIYKTDCHRH